MARCSGAFLFYVQAAVLCLFGPAGAITDATMRARSDPHTTVDSTMPSPAAASSLDTSQCNTTSEDIHSALTPVQAEDTDALGTDEDGEEDTNTFGLNEEALRASFGGSSGSGGGGGAGSDSLPQGGTATLKFSITGPGLTTASITEEQRKGLKAKLENELVKLEGKDKLNGTSAILQLTDFAVGNSSHILGVLTIHFPDAQPPELQAVPGDAIYRAVQEVLGSEAVAWPAPDGLDPSNARPTRALAAPILGALTVGLGPLLLFAGGIAP